MEHCKKHNGDIVVTNPTMQCSLSDLCAYVSQHGVQAGAIRASAQDRFSEIDIRKRYSEALLDWSIMAMQDKMQELTIITISKCLSRTLKEIPVRSPRLRR